MLSKVHMSFSSRPTRLCVPVMETITGDVEPIVIKRRLLIKLSAPTVFPLTSWDLFIMTFMVFPLALHTHMITGETEVLETVYSTEVASPCSGPVAHRLWGRIWEERAARPRVSEECDLLGHSLSAGRRVPWALRAGVGGASVATEGDSVFTDSVMSVTTSTGAS